MRLENQMQYVTQKLGKFQIQRDGGATGWKVGKRNCFKCEKPTFEKAVSKHVDEVHKRQVKGRVQGGAT